MREGGRGGEREGEREGKREGEMERRKEGGKEREREGGKRVIMYSYHTKINLYMIWIIGKFLFRVHKKSHCLSISRKTKFEMLLKCVAVHSAVNSTFLSWSTYHYCSYCALVPVWACRGEQTCCSV